MTIILSRMEASRELIEAIQREMKRQEISQSELARRAGVPQPNISRILAGGRGKISSELTRVLDALGLEIEARKK
jgi:predicted transcriptional regulator